MNLTFTSVTPLLQRMKTLMQKRSVIKRILLSNAHAAFALVLLFGLARSDGAIGTGKTFATAEEAVSALVSAATAKDSNALHALFGPAGAELENPDRVQSVRELDAFTAKPIASAACRIPSTFSKWERISGLSLFRL